MNKLCIALCAVLLAGCATLPSTGRTSVSTEPCAVAAGGRTALSLAGWVLWPIGIADVVLPSTPDCSVTRSDVTKMTIK